MLDIAASFEPVGLRSLDALHLATAVSIREEVGVLIAYDARLVEAAEASGLRVAAPGDG